MESNNNHNRLLQSFVVFIVVILIAGVLFIDNIYIAWLIIGLLGLDGFYLSIKHWCLWRKGTKNKISLQEHFLTFLASFMFLCLITGTGLFMMALVKEGETPVPEGEQPFKFVNAEYLLRSLTCSLQLFAGSIDSNVVDGIKDHQYLKGAISLQAVISFCCTIAVLLSLAFARVMAYFRLHHRTKIDSDHNHLYVFFGLNDPSRLLAKSIKEKEGDRAVIVFVENKSLNDDNQGGLENLIGLFTHRRQTFIDADELDARVTFTELQLCDIDREIAQEGADILGEINLITLRELILQEKGITDAQMHVFFLSENEDENIRALTVLANDITIKQVRKTKPEDNGVKQRFYCHARQNGLNRIIEDVAFKKGIEIRIIDSSHMAVELLKSDEINHPVHFVDLDEENPTTAKSPFNSLVIGFDEVGRDTLKFLYEFGAFVDSKASPIQEQRSPFHCVVIDKRMKELEGTFMNFKQAVVQQVNADGSPLVELKTCDCKGRDFFENILHPDFCRSVNYIVIAVGDDELGMTLAIRILNHIRRERANLSRMRIYVRSYRADKENYMQKIATYYNEGYSHGLREEESSWGNDAVIKLFGQSKNIYSYEMVVNEELIQKGRQYQAGYALLKGDKSWDERRASLQKTGSLDSIRKLRRQESQDLGNALHADTKIYLLKNALGKDYNWSDFLRRYFNDENLPQCEGSYDKINYPFLTPLENKIILNLARLEHIRWVASHEMLGYTKAHKGLHSCDERIRQHNCLCPWQELDDESRATLKSEWPSDYKSYDFGVVDNTILLNKEKLLVQ